MPRDATPTKLEIVTEIPDKAMVIFAHPDDAEIGSGGVVARWAAAGCEGTYVLCTNGAAGPARPGRAAGPPAQKRAGARRPPAELLGRGDAVLRGQSRGRARGDPGALGENVWAS